MFDQAILATQPASRPQRSRGSARLSVKKSGGSTRIENLFQQGCCKLRIPSKRADGLEVIMINSSGGMTGGDDLSWQFDLADGTNMTATTQACERVYASIGGTAQNSIKVSLGSNSKLAWLPQETILFDQGSFSRHLEIDMAVGAELLLVEPVIFGRTAMHESVKQGEFRDRWRIRRDGRLIHAEDTRICGDIHDLLQSASVTNGKIAMANVLLIAPHAEGLCSSIRQIINDSDGVSHWQDKLLVRLIASDGYALRQKLTPLINHLNNHTPIPKIWTL